MIVRDKQEKKKIARALG